MVPLSSIIKIVPNAQWKATPENANQKANVLAACEKIAARGVNPFLSTVIIDAGASAAFSGWAQDICPCLTRSRCGNFGYWCTSKGAHLDVHEMMMLQGLEPSAVDFKSAGVTAGQMASMLGNTMSHNVLCQLLPRVLYKAKLITKIKFDCVRGSV